MQSFRLCLQNTDDLQSILYVNTPATHHKSKHKTKILILCVCSPMLCPSCFPVPKRRDQTSQTLLTVTNPQSAEWCSVYAWWCQKLIHSNMVNPEPPHWVLQHVDCCGPIKALEQETVCQCEPRFLSFLLQTNGPDFTDGSVFSPWNGGNLWNLLQYLVELEACTVAHASQTLL